MLSAVQCEPSGKLLEEKEKDISRECCAILQKIRKHIPKRTFRLCQTHFDQGTFRIRKSGRYILSENIVFQPHPRFQFRPLPNSKYAKIPAYSLGFFAAITIECDGVEIDLAGHSISQSEECALFQRFYANIETASTPFLPGQGPGNFGPTIVSPQWIWIHDGILGRSSHHGIHGNGNQGVYINNVEIRDFEFVGAALNGGHNIVYEKCHIHSNWCNNPINAAWSAGLYLEQFIDLLFQERMVKDNPSFFSNLRASYARFKCILETTKSELLSGRVVSSSLFSNATGFPDGNVFGIVSHPLGVAIHDFAHLPPDKKDHWAEKIYIVNCRIHNLSAEVEEVIGLCKSDNSSPQKGVSGELFRILKCCNARGEYVSNAWTDLLMELGSIKHLYSQLNLGTLNISPEILDWSRKKFSIKEVLKRGYKYIVGQDAMGHQNKGVVGIRLDGTNFGVIHQTKIDHLLNIATQGSTLQASFLPPTAPSYVGTMTCGLHLSLSQKISLSDVCIHDLYSENGLAVGIKSIHHSSGYIFSAFIKNLRAGKYFKDGYWVGTKIISQETLKTKIEERFYSGLPNATPKSVGLYMQLNSILNYASLDVQFLYGPQPLLVCIAP